MPVTLAQLALFLPVAFLLSLAPGPDNLAVLSLGLSRGRSASLGFAMGCAAGCLNHTLLAALGVSALIAASPTAFRMLQYAGAVYLCWLGWQSLKSRGDRLVSSRAQNPSAQAATRLGSYFRRGLIANAINPKVGLFFLALLPQFVNASAAPPGVQIAVLGIVFALVAALVFGVVALTAGQLGAWLQRRPKMTRWLNRASGLLFIGLGMRLALADLPAAR